MTCIAMGLIAVPTAGTPVPLTPNMLNSAQLSQMPPSGLVCKVEVWPNPSAAGKVYVKSGGTILAALPVASSGAVYPWSTPELDENSITPWSGGSGYFGGYFGGGGGNLATFNSAGGFQLDAATSGDGAYVVLWVI